MKYFVLALFINSVASSPYDVPKNSGRETFNHELNSQRNDEGYLPHDEPSYMSPIPTKRDRRPIEYIIRDTRSLTEPSHLENDSILTKYTNEKKTDDSKTNIPVRNYRAASSRIEFGKVKEIPVNVAISTRSYSNPSVARENDSLTGLLRNKPVVNNIISSSGLLHNREIKLENRRLDPLNNFAINSKQPALRIRGSPENRITFQESPVPGLTNFQSYRPATPVNDFNLDREWTKISNEPGNLPEWIVERLKRPLDIQNVRQPAISYGKVPENRIQKIITDPRIQNVLASTKQIKRYMVIHPDGTVEHFDELEHISAKHPDFVLVKAAKFRNNEEIKVESTPFKNRTVSLNSNSSESTRERLTGIEESSIKADSVHILPSTVYEEVASTFPSSITPEPVFTSTLEIDTEEESITTIKNDEKKPIKDQDKVEIEVENVSNSDDTSNIISENNEAVAKIDESTPNALITHDLTTTSDNTNQQVIHSFEESTKEIAETTVAKRTIENIVNGSNSSVQSTQNDERTETSESKESASSGNPVLLETLDPEFWQKVTNGTDTNSVIFYLVNHQKDDFNSTVQSTLNDYNTEVSKASAKETKRSGKPAIFDTSDPEFWQKVTDSTDGSSIIFFLVKSGPSVEKNVTNTMEQWYRNQTEQF